MAQILIVDDDPSIQEVLSIALSHDSHNPLQTTSIEEAIQCLSREFIDLAIVDLRLGQENGIDLLKMINTSWPFVPVLIITAYADSATAVQAMKLGAKDYIAKPFDIEELILLVERLLQEEQQAHQSRRPQKYLSGRFGTIIGECPQIQKIFSFIHRIAPTEINVLITGESGTGKELIARAIHEYSPRKNDSLMIINCGSIPTSLVESELFGYRKGAFTGADRSKIGLLEKANHGSVFLDEIGELQPETQVKILRCLQDGSFIPVGGTELRKSDIRFLAATNAPIKTKVAEGSFREDLFYRLSGVIIEIPPLRERDSDVLLLAEHFLQSTLKEQNKRIQGLTKEARYKLQDYHYPGNIRELKNIIERAVALETGTKISASSLIIYEHSRPPSSNQGFDQVFNGEMTLDQYLQEQDKQILQSALQETGGRKSKAAQLLGLSFRQFRYRLKKYRLTQKDDHYPRKTS
jgi:two-component system response regulator PilR (NtrC family)